MTHIDIINFLIKENGYKSYLEIGVDTGWCFQNINCENKYCVDPYFFDNNDAVRTEAQIPSFLTWRMTSDEMFDTVAKDMKFDIIFIDGMHTEEFAGRDIINSLKHLNKGGRIVVHDCIPASYGAQLVPRVQCEWNGDVWKAITMLKTQGIEFSVVDTDYGCGIIEYRDNPQQLVCFEKSAYSYHDLMTDRNNILNVITVQDFIKRYRKTE